MKKKSIVKLFFLSLLKSLIALAVIMGVGYASYRISYIVLSDKGESIGTEEIVDQIDDILDKAQKDDISKNLIYVCNSKGLITDLLVEICNTQTNNMDYVTIPVKTDYTIPTTMYQKLFQINDEIPQIVRISKLKQYFKSDEEAYGYGELIIEKMIGTEISYYTVLDSETFSRHYDKVNTKVAFKHSITDATPNPDTGKTPTSEKVSTKMDIAVGSDLYIRQLQDLGGDRDKIAEYIKEQYEEVESNLTVYNKIAYIDCYEKLDVSMYHYWGVPGVFEGKFFQVDTKAAKAFFKDLVENPETYTEAQNLGKPVSAPTGGNKASKAKPSKKANSKKKKIIVLNGSRIAGLAASTQEKLKADGYNVPEVGDYSQEVLTRTRIIVKKKNQGSDLVSYFKNPEVVVGTVQDGYDIEIILGTADANQ